MIKDTEEFPMLLDVYDVLIPDLKSNDLHKKISDQLEVKYLSDSAHELDEVKGKIFGEARRLIGLMTMRIERNIKNIYFLVDMGYPKTSICEEVLSSYNLSTIDPNEHMIVILNKRPTKVIQSPIGSHFSDINLLGADFLDLHGAKLFADYEERYFTIKFRNQTSEKKVAPTLQTSTTNTADINPMVFAGSIFICLLVVILVYLFVRFRRKDYAITKLAQARKKLTPQDQQRAE